MMMPNARSRGSKRCRWALAALLLSLAGPVAAASPDLALARQLLDQGRYQEAYEALAPHQGQLPADDASFSLLFGEAALRNGRPEEAKAQFNRSLELDPESMDARLGLGRALLALGDYARAKIEFEQVFDYEELPLSLAAQAEAYEEAALDYAEGRRTSTSGYAILGAGNYRVGSAGGGPRNEPFYMARVGGRVNHRLDDTRTLRGSLDYRFRDYDAEGRRNDSDLRWNGALRGTRDGGNWTAGTRGRVSYRGNGNYRNDFGAFGEYGWQLDEDTDLGAGLEVRQRRYPTGRLRDRTRNIVELTGSWTRAFADGDASFTLSGQLGREFNTRRQDGNSNFFGLSPQVSYSFSEDLGGNFFVWWQNDRYNIERLGPPGDEILGIGSRNDDLYEVGGGLSWEFAPDWSLNPEVLYIRDFSNILAVEYSSTELWLTLRNDF